MASVLVTGGAGFLGSHLCDRLIERGDGVLCLDNFYTGSKANIAHLLMTVHGTNPLKIALAAIPMLPKRR